ncbi:MAG: hypothetical protein ACRDV3_10500 [Acidothermaceae bacterium]
MPSPKHPTLQPEWRDLLRYQHGAFSRRQALAFGVTDAVTSAQLKAHRWQRLYPGTFVAHNSRIEFRTRAWAAVLCCGGTALASHRTAAYLAGLLDQPPGVLEVSVPAARRPRGAAGIVVRRRRLELSCVASPPRTTIEDTVLDLIDQARQADEVVALLTAACQRRLSTAARLVAALARRQKLRWRPLVCEVLDDGEGVHSPLEWRYLRDVERAHGLPRADRQTAGMRGRSKKWRDVHYRKYRLVIELDGAAAHPEERRHRDMARDNGIVVEGQAVLSYGWHDVAGTPCGAAEQVVVVLKARGWDGVPRRCGPDCTLRGPF